MAEVRRDGDALQADKPRAQHIRPRGDNPTTSESILVQVHLHGGDARQYRGLPTDLRALDGVATGRAGLEHVHKVRTSIQRDRSSSTLI